jgi:hypothetical protein
LPGTNTLAYYECSYITEKKVLYHWALVFREKIRPGQK